MAREHWTLLRVLRQLNGRTSTGARQATVAERTADSWKTLEQADVLSKDLKDSIGKQILSVAASIREGH